jgi:hypothetical protein
MPTLDSLESMRLYGIPTEIDGIELSLIQGKVLLGIIDKAMDQAGHPLREAIEVSVPAFRKMYAVVDGQWRPKRMIRLDKGHGKAFRNKHWEEPMGRGKVRSNPYREVWEAGARNNRKDKGAIKEVVRLALGQLADDDALGVLKELGLRFKKKKKGKECKR